MKSEDTHRLLTAHAPKDDQEARHRSRMLELVQHAKENAFDRGHWIPGHFTASAFVLSPERDALLLIHHGKLDRWLQPGGHIEANDRSAFEAALREVEEEVGVHHTLLESDRALFDVDVHPIPARKNDPSHEHFDLRFLFVARSRDFEAGEEVNDASWFPIEALAREADDESVSRAVRKLLTR